MILAAFAYQQNVPPAPGRSEGTTSSTPKATEQAPGTPPAQGEGQPPPGGGFGGLPFMLLLLGMLVFLMFWSSRSQQKKQQATLASLKKGDRVITQAGLVGKLIEVGERYAKVEIAPGVRVELLKSGLLGKDTAETVAAAEKKK